MNELIVRYLPNGSVEAYDRGILLFRWPNAIKAAYAIRDIIDTGCKVIYEL
jgi:hypothetical protein